MVSLNSSRAKLGRARTHKEALEQELVSFRKTEPQALLTEIDPETGEKLWRPRGPIKQPSDLIRLLLGDSLYNYRATLDHLAWSLVEVNGQTPTHRTAFCLYSDPDRFKRYFGTETKGMSAQAKAMIKAEQPCYAQNDIRGTHLAYLERLSNTDKHRHLHLIVENTDGGMFSEGLPIQFAFQNLIHEGPVDNKTILAHIPGDYAHVDFYPVFGVAFDPNGDDAPGESVLAVITMLDYIVGEILDQFDRTFF